METLVAKIAAQGGIIIFGPEKIRIEIGNLKQISDWPVDVMELESLVARMWKRLRDRSKSNIVQMGTYVRKKG